MIKSILTIMMLGFLTFVNANPPVKATVYKIDTKNSTLKWTGKKPAGSHEGTVMIKSGSLVMDGDMIKSGSFEMDMNAMKCTDLDADNGGKLVGHLQGEDFFNVKSHPTSKFVITKATKKKAGVYTIVGDLTMRGVTKPVSFDATLKGDAKKKVATGKVVVDRTKYDMKFASKNFFENLGDKFVNDDFDVDMNLVFVK